MLFNSIHYSIFLPVVFVLYWFAAKKSLKLQNVLLLFSSYFFYACWDWRFLFLLLFSTFLDYYTGIRISDTSTESKKKFWFWLSISINIGFLGIFKYYNFFIESFTNALRVIDIQVNPMTLNVILPVGISFYTFHGLSYVIDIYRGRISAEKDFVDYSLFVSFFPLLVAGPIERATHLLPQLKCGRVFEYKKAVDGLRQILWGLFKKVVIADQCAEYVNLIFDNADQYSGLTLMVGAVLFAFQIYGDFSGYSDIALGTARLFGIQLLQNFSYPYFSRDVSEFWRRWHISLSSWFKDYLYIPLGGSKGTAWIKVRNVFAIFIVSGFWHGANWTFIVWGGLNALFVLPSILLKTNRNNLAIVAQGKIFPTVKEVVSILFTFSLTTIAWIFFRAESIGKALQYLYKMCTDFSLAITVHISIKIYVLIVLFLLVEWLGREQKYALAVVSFTKHRIVRWVIYYILIIAVLYFSGKEEQFIYFQF